MGGISAAASGGDFWDGFWDGAVSGAITGGITGGISGGITGYQLAKMNGANPWTGNKIEGITRSYHDTGHGNLADYNQVAKGDGDKYCAAYNYGFATNTDPNQYKQYCNLEGGGADMKKFLNAANVKGVQSQWKGKIDFDNLGAGLNAGAEVFSTSNGHHWTIVSFTVGDKVNLFFGGTHQVLTEVGVYNSFTGTIVNWKGTFGRITWGY